MFFYWLLFYQIIILIPESSFASNRIALVIGDKDYKVSPLKSPVNDAKEDWKWKTAKIRAWAKAWKIQSGDK